mgnify:CR=1 FL=1
MGHCEIVLLQAIQLLFCKKDLSDLRKALLVTTDNFYNQNVSVRSVRQENFCVLDLASEKQQHFQSAPNTEINLWRPFSLSRALQWLWSQLLKSLVKTISKTFPWRKGLEKYSTARAFHVLTIGLERIRKKLTLGK